MGRPIAVPATMAFSPNQNLANGEIPDAQVISDPACLVQQIR